MLYRNREKINKLHKQKQKVKLWLWEIRNSGERELLVKGYITILEKNKFKELLYSMLTTINYGILQS